MTLTAFLHPASRVTKIPPPVAAIFWSVLLLVLSTMLPGQAAGTVPPPAPLKILVLDSYQRGLPIPEGINKGILAALSSGGFSVGDLFMEHLDLARIADGGHRADLANLLRHKLSNRRIGIVIPIGAPAVDFMAREGKGLFPDAAVVAVLSPNIQALGDAYGGRVVNVPWHVDPAGTLRVALALFPETRRVFVVTGGNDGILPFLDQARKAFAPWRGALEIEYSNAMSYDQMLRRIAALPPDAIVLYSPYFTDATGRTFIPVEVAATVCRTARVPVFATLEQFLGSGVLGGVLLKTENMGRLAGKSALDLLAGRMKLDRPVTTLETVPTAEFDWQALMRWRADPSRLPKGSTFVNRPATLWGQYKAVVVAATLVALALVSLIVALITLNRHLRRMTALANDSEARFRVMVENAPEAILVYDIDLKRIVDANAKAELLFGCSREVLLQGGLEPFHSQLQPDGTQVSMEEQSESVMTGLELVLERAVRSLDGRELTCELRLVRLPYRDQRLVRASFVDISDRKLAEEAVRRSEAHYHALFDNALVGVTVTDRNFLITDANDAFCNMLDYSKEEIIGKKSIADVSHPDGIGQSLEMVRKLVHREVDHFAMEKNYLTKAGRTVPTMIFVKGHYDVKGEYEGTTASILDISDLKEADEKLRLTRFSIERSSDCIFWITPEARIVDVNEAACRTLGYEREELLQLTIPEIDPLCNANVWRQHFQDLRRKGALTFETVHAAKDGRQIPVEVVANYIRFGAKECNCAVVRNISERKQAEEKWAKLENELHQAQKMESVGRLAGGVAHDFNNMLSVILGHANLALMKSEPSDPLYPDLEQIRKAGERSADLTRQLLAFARKQTIAPKVLDLNATIDGMLVMLERLLGENVSLVWRPAPDLMPVKMDTSQVDQILANLCVNARDAISDVGHISIETGNCTIDAGYCTAKVDVVPGEYVRLSVSDDGCGMDKDVLAHVFEPFFTTKAVGEGTGLGLATVYGIVKQNKGFINAYSEKGRGTTFNIYIPQQPEEAEPTPVADAERLPEGGHEVVLLVEDESAILNVTAQLLSIQGYEVLAASTPSEAIRLAREYRGEIHLLMTDVIMPEMNGLDLSKNIRTFAPRIKCLFMSGYTANVIALHGVLDEGTHFIQKPFSMAALASKVREALDRS